MLDAGPAAWSWDEDKYWTLAWIAEIVRKRTAADLGARLCFEDESARA